VKLSLHHPRRARTATIAVASAAAGMALTVPGLALATNSGQSVPPPPAVPTSDSQIQNIDQVKTAIKGYYGDRTTTVIAPGTDPNATNPTYLHQFSDDSNYAHQTEGIAAQAEKYLAKQAKPHKKHDGMKAVVFDVDDTLLNTYSYEIFSNFVYNPATNANFVNAGSADVFPAVPGMVGLEKAAIDDGYAVFFITGRPATPAVGTNPANDQTPGTLANLTSAKYDVDPDNLFLKDSSATTEPWLKSCVKPAPTEAHPDGTTFTCNTIQYKSMTRQHIEQDLGYDIVANFGDQYSDLSGGYADMTYKIPNPMYYLP
jgi:predicted secreted acid phosphatase